MRAIKLISIVFVVSVFLGVVATAEASLLEPLTTDQFQILTGGASYGPPPALGFSDGPTSVQSGDEVPVYYGPGPGQDDNVNAVLFVISALETDLQALNSDFIRFSLNSEIVDFEYDNFFTTEQTGFPPNDDTNNIGGIGQGEVGGIKFPDAKHAGTVLYGADLTLPGSTGTIFDYITIETPFWPLRVDLFNIEDFAPPSSDIEGTISGNTPNSHALAVVPEPATMLLLGSGLIGFAVVGRKKLFKKK